MLGFIDTLKEVAGKRNGSQVARKGKDQGLGTHRASVETMRSDVLYFN